MAFPTIYFGNDQSYYLSRPDDNPYVTFTASGNQVLQLGTTSIQMGTNEVPVEQTVTGLQRVIGQSTFDQPIVSMGGIRLGSTSGSVTITPKELLTLSGVTTSLQTQLTSVSTDVTSNYVTLGTSQNITGVKTFQSAPALLHGITLGTTAVSAQTLSYLKNVTSDIQYQIDILSTSQSSTTSNSVTLSGTQSISGIKTFTMAPYFNGGAFFSAAPTLAAGLVVGTTAVSNAKLHHINGLRSDVQFQLDTHETDIGDLQDTVMTLEDDQTIVGTKQFEMAIHLEDGIVLEDEEGTDPITLTNDELGYLSGVTSSIQDQFDDLTDDIGTLQTSYATLGTAQTIAGVKTFSAAPVVAAGLSNGSVTLSTSELGYLSGLSSNIQQQLNTVSDRAASSANAAGGASGSTFPISGPGNATLAVGSTSVITTAGNPVGAILFRNNGTGIAHLRSHVDTTDEPNSGNLVVSTANAGVMTEALRVNKAGLVGINNTNPTYRLDIGGDVNFSGNLFRDGIPFATTSAGEANGTIVGVMEVRADDISDDPDDPTLLTDDDRVTLDDIHDQVMLARVVLDGTSLDGETVASYLRLSRSDIDPDANEFTAVFTFYDGMHTKGVELTFQEDEDEDGILYVFQSDAMVWMGPIIEYTETGLVSVHSSDPDGYSVSTLRMYVDIHSLATWSVNTANDLYYTDGRIGIGTTVPGYTLDVKGNINFTGNLYQNGSVFVSSGGGGGGGGGSSQIQLTKEVYLTSVSRNASSRTTVVSDSSITLSQLYQSLPFMTILLNGDFVSKDTPATYLRGSLSAISSGVFTIVFAFFDGNFTKGVELTFRDTGTLIDVYHSNSVYWSGRLFDYQTGGMTSIYSASPTGYTITGLRIQAYVTSTINAGGYGIVGVKEISIASAISVDANARTTLTSDTSITMTQVYNNMVFADVLLNGSFIGNDTTCTYLRGSRTAIASNSFSLVFAFQDGNGYTKGVRLTVRQNGTMFDIYQSDTMYWQGDQGQYTTTGLTSIYSSTPTGYQVSYLRMHVYATGSSNWAPAGPTKSDLAFTTGNVGIRHSNPRCELSVGADGDVNGSGYLPGVSMKNTATTQRSFSVGQGDANNVRMTWQHNATASLGIGIVETYSGNNPLILQRAGGNVGIGITTPFARLTIADSDSIFVGNSPASAFRFHHTNDNSFLDFGSGHLFIRSSTGAGTEVDRLAITSTGNVGIGTLTPRCRLQVDQGFGNNDNGIIITNSNYGSDQYLLMTMVNRGSGNFNSYAKIQGKTSGVSGTTHMCLQPDEGYVGVGTSAPSTKLHVYGGSLIELPGASANTCLEIHGVATGTSEYNLIAAGHGTSKSFVVRGTGSVGINVETPDYTLHVNGSLFSNTAWAYGSGTNLISQALNSREVIQSIGPMNSSVAGGLEMYIQRFNTNFDWTSTGVIFQYKVDASYFSYLRFQSNGVTISDLNIVNTFSCPSGLSITGQDPGDLISKRYGAGDRYGIGQYNLGTVRTFISNAYVNGSIRFSRATDDVTNKDASFADLMTITYNGNVGIGTNNPSDKLTVNGNQLVEGVLRTYANGTGGPSIIYSENAVNGDGYATLHCRNNTGTGVYLFLNSSGRTDDGGANTATLRNDAGSLRLLSLGGNGFTIDATTGYTKHSAGDSSKILFGPNTQWGSYLSVGAGPSAINANTCQVISTNGNLHLDAGLGKQLYLNHYAYMDGNVGGILSYGPWTHFDSTNNQRFTVTGDGKFGWNTTSPAGIFQINGTGNIASTILITNAEASDTDTRALLVTQNNASLLPSMSNGNMYFYGSWGSTPYRIIQAASTYFTGQHANQPVADQEFLKTNVKDHVGLIVSSADQGCYSINPVTKEIVTGKAAISISESLPYIKLSDKDQDKAVWGVVTNVKNENYNTDGTVDTDENTEWGDRLDTMVRVNGLGEGAIWVTNVNGPIENGDYICSSIIPGHGRRQSDDILHNYTVAKATMSCDFDVDSDKYVCVEIEHNGILFRKAFIPCTYHCS